MKKHAVLVLALVAATVSAAPAAVDPFYQGLLRDGQHAFDRNDYAAAARDLRLACFGMLDDPQPLADCLVRLALAQDRLDDAEGFRGTFQRLVELEDRFKAYTQGTLAPELRTTLEARLAARIPAATLAGIPAFRTIKAPAAQAGPAAGPSETERKALIRARLILSEQKPGKEELEEAFRISRQVADTHADLKEAHHLAAEASYRLRRWKEALQYFRSGGDPGESQPDRLFYMAVTLYESGDAAGAATAMKRALPNLQRTSYVDSYSQKILGAAVQ